VNLSPLRQCPQCAHIFHRWRVPTPCPRCEAEVLGLPPTDSDRVDLLMIHSGTASADMLQGFWDEIERRDAPPRERNAR
jgi:hypothetical protein